jgi:hypothetical protein
VTPFTCAAAFSPRSFPNTHIAVAKASLVVQSGAITEQAIR